MRTTIDEAGRVVIPKPLRDALGIAPGEVEVTQDASGIRIEPLAESDVTERNDRLVIEVEGDVTLTDEDVRELRFADQR